ncbi:hypothetical protein Tco_0066065, partial [Tanacetum coccineum]
VAKNASNQRKWKGDRHESSSKNKGLKVIRAHAIGPSNKKVYAGKLPHYNKCKLHHNGPCYAKCGKYKEASHLARDYRGTTVLANQRTFTCFKCGEQGNYREFAQKNSHLHLVYQGMHESKQGRGIMLDINLFKEEKGYNPEIIRESQHRRFKPDEIALLDKEWRQLNLSWNSCEMILTSSTKKYPNSGLTFADSLDSLHINASTATECIPFTASIMNKLTPEKFGFLKGQVIDSRITTIDILKDQN